MISRILGLLDRCFVWSTINTMTRSAKEAPPPSNKPSTSLEDEGWWVASDGRVLPNPPPPSLVTQLRI